MILVIIGLLLFPLDFAWFYIFAPVGLIFCLSSFLLPLLYLRRVPPVARTLIEAKEKSQVPALIVHDSGRSYLTLLLERMAEGVVVTTSGKYKLLPQSVDFNQAFDEEVGVPDKTTKKKPNPNPEADPPPEPKRSFSADLFGWISHRSILVGLGLPFYVGYSGSLCLLNPEALALYEAGELFIPSENKPVPKGDDKGKMMPLMWLDPSKIKHIINKRFSTSQIDAMMIDVDRRARIYQMSPVMKALLVIVVIVVIVGALAFLFLK
jgi:hypothetical protein